MIHTIKTEDFKGEISHTMIAGDTTKRLIVVVKTEPESIRPVVVFKLYKNNVMVDVLHTIEEAVKEYNEI